MDDRRNPMALWSMVLIGAMFFYPLSLGPACWFSSRVGGEKVVTIVYRPIT